MSAQRLLNAEVWRGRRSRKWRYGLTRATGSVSTTCSGSRMVSASCHCAVSGTGSARPATVNAGPRRRGGAVSGRPPRRVSAAYCGPRAARVCLRPASATARGHTPDDAAGLHAPRPDCAVDLADFERLVPAGANRCSCRRWSASVAFRERPYARLICAKAKPESRVFAPRSMRDNCDQPRSRERRRSFPGSLQGGEMIYTGAATTP